MENFNLTPSPLLLSLIGQIPFKGWQCIAELLDNSIDAILNNSITDSNQKVIRVTIPTKAKLKSNEPLIVEDWGIGMDENMLQNAVRAGYTSKNTHGNLGLFGMGFNVATSRIANVVEVWTSTVEMDNEIGVRIDLREMARSDSFIRPKLKRSKKLGKKSGTEIRVYDFKPIAENLLNIRDIKEQIRRAYSATIFAENAIRVFVNEDEISPFKFCVWDSKRSVRYKHDDIPALINIDEHLKDELFCENCFTWLGEPIDSSIGIECSTCHQSSKIIKKSISVFGWVGIQRYGDMNHFGINISRNGRILSQLDKSFFTWIDKQGTHDPIFEYPRDTPHAGGRIVGEIEVNFVIPEYTKDNFIREDKNWILVMEFLKGTMPLQPEIAASLGFRGRNRSPLSMLFSGYRKVTPPGTKTLIFSKSDGSADYQTPKAWAQKFYDGDPDYQNDTKWWEAVLRSDLKESNDNFDIKNPYQTGTGKSLAKSNLAKDEEPEKYPGKKVHKRSQRFDLEQLLGERPISVSIIEYYPENDIHVPIIFEPKGQGSFHVYLNNNHPLFRDFADGYEDLIYMEVASKFAALKNSDSWTVTRIYYEIKFKYASETMLNVDNLVNKANTLMRNLQEYLISGDGFPLYRQPNIGDSDLKKLKKEYLDLENKNLVNVDEVLSNSKYVKYLELKYLFHFIKEYPELFFDGKYFNLPYTELDDDVRLEQLEKYLNYFNDVKWFILELNSKGVDAIRKLKSEIIRNRYSIEILYGSINK